MIRKVELATNGFNFFGSIIEGSNPSGSTKEKTALIIHFETSVKISFVACFSFYATIRNSHKIGLPKNVHIFWEKEQASEW